MKVRILHNGVKINGGSLERCYPTLHEDRDYVGDSIPTHVVLCVGYGAQFSTAVRDSFTRNGTHAMLGFFDDDHIRISEESPLFNDAVAAYAKRIERLAKKQEKLGYMTRSATTLAQLSGLLARIAA